MAEAHGAIRNQSSKETRQIGALMQDIKPAPHEQIFSVLLGFWQARALAVATELGLSDLLVKGPLHVDELASRTKTNASALLRLLRALESVGIFARVTSLGVCHVDH